jgi:AcrR family transcriptional regulator
METENLSTKERILQAATGLIADQGFKETTTKDIALAAGVSEMSVFRHFGSKKTILADIMKRYSFEYPIGQGLKEQLIWELEPDLLLLARMQYHFNLRNEKAVLIRFKESRNLLELGMDMQHGTRSLKMFLISYFDEMRAQGKIIALDNEKLAAYFMSFNFGLFCSKMMSSVYGDIMSAGKEEEIRFGVQCFVHGITP